MSKSSTVMAELMSAGHPDDFILCTPFSETPAEFLGLDLFALVMGFKPDKEKQSREAVCDKELTCTAEAAGCYSNGDGDEEDSVAWEETRKDCREKERERKLLKHKLARKIATARKG
ncbi:hypothetical protein RHGRI_037264 [Rhododendron griersonianum]|uniref:Uncharacterized protein n=1 Tax=Rhododendron griersonianum TaxID=479676 RepID=A0AAV6HR50_9ERIC|nr:hypothetical protein RHGRI_037264 [Rhododendron griersonianum]